MTQRWKSALLLGAGCALAGCLFFVLPWSAQLEQSVGLRGLFQARGPLPPPQDLVIVAITKDAAGALHLPYKTEQWPRSLHARLVDGLARSGVDSIVFDLAFRQSREADDAVFAESMRNAGNVLLLEFLEKSTLGADASRQPGGQFELHQLMPPVRPLAEAALATGPFTVPKVPLQVAQFWTFDANAGDAPSLPLLAMLVKTAGIYDLLRSTGLLDLPDQSPAEPVATPSGKPDAAGMINAAPELRHRLLTDTRLRQRVMGSLSAAIADADRERLDRLLAALSDPTSRFLNFFGPPWTVRTVPYDKALRLLEGESTLSETGIRWQGATVLVGLSSPVQWEQSDEFVTPFSDRQSGHDLSGIEILATAFANLRDDTVVRPLAPFAALLLILFWGLLIGIGMRLYRPAWGVLGLLALTSVYALGALAAFEQWNLWLPLVSPLAVQVPLAIIAATSMHYVAAKRERQRIREVFGYYLPEPVVDRLATDGHDPGSDRETVFGVCLYSDAAAYTTLSEAMEPGALADFMNAYYDVIFEPVRRRGGIISDVVGDAMMAIWASRENDENLRVEACRAALEIQDALKQRSAAGSDRLPLTRIGVHCGIMALAHVGARHHFEYRAVGDIVNTASRLQALNKDTGTRILLSAEMLQGIELAETRALGSFVLPGRRSATEVVELRGWRESAPGRGVAGIPGATPGKA